MAHWLLLSPAAPEQALTLHRLVSFQQYISLHDLLSTINSVVRPNFCRRFKYFNLSVCLGASCTASAGRYGCAALTRTTFPLYLALGLPRIAPLGFESLRWASQASFYPSYPPSQTQLSANPSPSPRSRLCSPATISRPSSCSSLARDRSCCGCRCFRLLCGRDGMRRRGMILRGGWL